MRIETRWYLRWTSIDGGIHDEYYESEDLARARLQELKPSQEKGYNTGVRLISKTTEWHDV